MKSVYGNLLVECPGCETSTFVGYTGSHVTYYCRRDTRAVVVLVDERGRSCNQPLSLALGSHKGTPFSGSVGTYVPRYPP